MEWSIRRSLPHEYWSIGRLVVEVYASLPGMPKVEEQPEYYGMLADVGKRQRNPSIGVFVAVAGSGEILGCVDFIDDMRQYGSGGTAGSVPDAAGIRLLAVTPGSRAMGIGKALTQFCIAQARQLGRSTVVLHTTRAMEVAWRMYQGLGFERFPEIDFKQGNLDVYGFKLSISAPGT